MKKRKKTESHNRIQTHICSHPPVVTDQIGPLEADGLSNPWLVAVRVPAPLDLLQGSPESIDALLLNSFKSLMARYPDRILGIEGWLPEPLWPRTIRYLWEVDFRPMCTIGPGSSIDSLVSFLLPLSRSRKQWRSPDLEHQGDADDTEKR